MCKFLLVIAFIFFVLSTAGCKHPKFNFGDAAAGIVVLVTLLILQ